MNKFQIEEKALEINLFAPEEPKQGPYTSLNVNYLPHLAAHILQKLNHKERCSVIEFELQTSLLELALIQHKFKSIKDITNYMIREMRMTPKFWIHSSESWNEVQIRTKMYHALQPKCNQEEQLKKAGGKKSLSEILLDSTALRKYISQLDLNKLDYKSEFMKIPEVLILVSEYDQANSQNKQLQAIETYVNQNLSIAQQKQKKYIFKLNKALEQLQQQQQQQQTKQVDLYQRISQPHSKETRERKSESVSYRDLRVLLKEQQKIDVEEKRTIFVPNQVYKYQKIDIIILPYVYKFIFNNQQQQFTQNHLKIQNLILHLSLSDSEVYKGSKQKKNILITDQDDSKQSQKLFHKYLDNSKDKLMIQFDQFCKSQQINLAFYFSSTPSTYRKELLLIRNILILAMKYAQQLFNITYDFSNEQEINDLDLEDDEKQPQQKSVTAYQKWNKIDLQNDYYYFQVLSQLELYYNIPLDQYGNLLKVYQSCIEVVLTSKKNHFKEYFGVIRTEKDQLFGVNSSLEQIQNAIEQYLTYINAPKTQKKRSYIFHSEKRKEWDQQQYKLFLEGLYKNFEIVVNNKRIAKHMGDVDPNHVKFVKGFYLRGLKKRAREKNMNRKELLKDDIENFDLGIFDRK